MSAVWVARDGSGNITCVSHDQDVAACHGVADEFATVTRETLLTDNQRAVIQIAMWWVDEHTKDKLGPITCAAENELVTAVTILRRDNATV